MPYQFERERWRKLYTTESAKHRLKPFFARAMRDTLIRYGQEDTGILTEGSTKERALAALQVCCSVHPDELPTWNEYLEIWVQDGYLKWLKRGRTWVLSIARFVNAQEARSPAAKRQAAYRKRMKEQEERERQGVLGAASPASPVTPTVTPPVASPPDSPVTVDRGSREREDLERKREDLRARSAGWLADPVTVGMSVGQPHTWIEVKQVLSHFNRVWDKNINPLTSGDNRVQTIVGRFSDGYQPAKLSEALSGAKRSKWICQNGNMHSINVLLKDADAVDKYAAMVHAPGGSPGVQPEANSGSYDNAAGWGDDIKRGPVDFDEGTDLFDDDKELAADG